MARRSRRPRGKRTHRELRHGLSYTVEYRTWQTMRHRCTNPNSPAWAAYGGRGITICDRWLDSPENFLADMGPRPEGHEIDRIDNDGPYSPENCRWTTRSENDRNRRSNVFLDAFGERRTIAEWCEKYGVPNDTLKWRLRNGRTPEVALTTPVRAKKLKRQGTVAP